MLFKTDILHKKSTYRTFGAIAVLGIVMFAITANRDKELDYAIISSALSANSSEVIIEWRLTNDVSCHDKFDDDALPKLDKNYTPPSHSIFLHETSCRGGLNSRQACAVESAARAHPKWHVHMLFSGPVSKFILEKSCLGKLLTYNNVKLFRINHKDYAKGTPVQKLIEKGSYKKSKYRVEHSSDVLRYLTLYKYSGVYMDSDVVVVKPFDTLASNWAARESSYAVDSGLMSFSKDALGRKIAKATILDCNKNYNPNKWGTNGPGVITRVIKGMCSKNNTNWIEGCQGFVVYDPEVFYPVYYPDNKKYFEAGRKLVTSNRTYAHHMWNALTHTYDVPKTSPYAELAKKYCPKVYAMYGDKFGV